MVEAIYFKKYTASDGTVKLYSYTREIKGSGKLRKQPRRLLTEYIEKLSQEECKNLMTIIGLNDQGVLANNEVVDSETK